MDIDSVGSVVCCHAKLNRQAKCVSSPALLSFQQTAVRGDLHFQTSLDIQQYTVLVILTLHVSSELPELSL